MNDHELLSDLLARTESDVLDFKAAPYHLGNENGDSKFIKDILAMANNPKDGSAYIVLGAREEGGIVVDVPGVAHHPDAADLGKVVSGKVSPSPRFTYKRLQHREVELGLIEISQDQPAILIPNPPKR